MAKKIETMDDMRPNLFDAIKRAFIFKRGVVARSKPAPESKAETEESGSSPDGKIPEKESILKEDKQKRRAAKELTEKSDIHYEDPLPKESSASQNQAAEKRKTERTPPSEKHFEEKIKKVEQTLKELKAEKNGDKPPGETEKDKAGISAKARERVERKIERNPMMAAAKGETPEPGGQKIEEIKQQTEEVLYEAETVFPFTLFPDTLKLDREKFTMAKRSFFRTAVISSVPVSEIMSAEASVGPFFGSLHLILRFFNDNEKTFTFLQRQDAINLQRLLHGFIIAHHKAIDLSKVPAKELRETLTQIGQGVKD
jgi:hypothetical protein